MLVMLPSGWIVRAEKFDTAPHSLPAERGSCARFHLLRRASV
jgi:hypothetical protein